MKLPPGYDGSAFRHDTGELRRYDGVETETKVHSPIPDTALSDEKNSHPDPEKIIWEELPAGHGDFGDTFAEDREHEADAPAESEKTEEFSAGRKNDSTPNAPGNSARNLQNLLDGLFSSLTGEDWLLVTVILLLLADGSDAWDVILLLGLLLAVH